MAEEQIVPIFEILVDGAEIPPHAKQDVLVVSVEQDRDKADTFTIEMNNDAFWSDSDKFCEGKPIKIKMGYLGSQPEVVFDGEILKREVEFGVGGRTTLFLSGLDCSHRLRRTYYHRSFVKMTDSEIAQKVAKDAGLTAEVEATQPKHEWVYQVNQTNIDFLKERAKPYDYEVKVEGKKMRFKKAQKGGAEAAKLKWGETLHSFRPRLTTSGQISDIEVRGWDPDTKKEVIGKAGASDVGPKLGSATGTDLAKKAFGKAMRSISDKPFRTVADAEKFAKSRMAEISMGFVTGEGTCRGNPKVKAGKTISIEGIGKRFEGKYFLERVHHIFDKRGYTTMFCVERNGVSDASPPPVKDSESAKDAVQVPPSKPQEQKPEPVLGAANWSKERARENQAVMMHVEAYDFEPGAQIAFKIFHRGAGGKTQMVEEKQAQVTGTEAKVAWIYTYQDGRELQPADFFFKASGAGKEANSGLLKVRTSAVVDCNVGDTKIPLAGAVFEAKLPDGSTYRGKLDDEGNFQMPEFSPGKFEITIPDE